VRPALRGLAACVVIATSMATACAGHSHPGNASSPTSTAPPACWPEKLNDFSIVWTAEPGIDVTAWPAVAVRAYAESYLLAYVMGDNKFLYPGFQQAVDPNQSIDHPTGTQFLWPKTDDPSKSGWIGTERAHILSIATAGRDVTVEACTYQFGSADLDRNGKYSPVIAEPPPYSGISPLRITMTAPAHAGSQLPPQQGPARAPSVDVFNGWRITSHQGGYFARTGVGPEWPDFAETQAACLAKAPQHAQLVRGGEYDRANFPTLPPSPGWPATGTA
jgi:hypothetical protein